MKLTDKVLDSFALACIFMGMAALLMSALYGPSAAAASALPFMLGAVVSRVSVGSLRREIAKFRREGCVYPASCTMKCPHFYPMKLGYLKKLEEYSISRMHTSSERLNETVDHLKYATEVLADKKKNEESILALINVLPSDTNAWADASQARQIEDACERLAGFIGAEKNEAGFYSIKKKEKKVILPGRSTMVSVSMAIPGGESLLKEIYQEPSSKYIARLCDGTIVISCESVVSRCKDGGLMLKDGLKTPDDYFVLESIRGIDLKPNTELNLSRCYPVSVKHGQPEDDSMEITHE